MLNEEEEKELIERVESFKELTAYPEVDYITMPLKDAKWLVIKLIEINNEAAAYSQELFQTNEELARFREHYEGM